MKKNTLSRAFWSVVIACGLALTVSCSDDYLEPTTTTPTTTVSATSTTGLTDCGCTYTVPVSTNTITVDGQALGIKPGGVICLKGGATYGNIIFKNIRGTATAPITIKNCGGVATLNGSGKYFGLKTQLSSYLRITGGSTPNTYGIKINAGHHSVTLEYLTTNIELDHVEVANSGFSGIMAKTDPTCDNITNRGYFVMKDVKLHDNYVHDTAGEGFYVGHTFWNKGVTLSCGVRYPHAMEGVKIYNNLVKNSGWEAIQVGSSPTGVEVYNNRIENYGTKLVNQQNNGVQFGEGAPGKFYGNFIKGGSGHGLIVMGNPENFIHDNIIIDAGGDGIFLEDRSTGAGFKIINNTIINPKLNGIRLYTEMVTMNTVINNIVVNPGNYSKYTYPRTGNDAYLYLLDKTVKLTASNNHYTRDIASMKFASVSTSNYAPTSTSPVVNRGANIGTYSILLDQALKPRLKGTAYDIGAYEFQQ